MEPLFGPDESGASEAHITNGTPYSGHPSVGFMIIGGSTSCAGPLQGSICTSTLVGKKTVLTAAHCIKKGLTHIFCLAGSTYNAQNLIPHSGWNDQTLANDIGVMILSTAPPITPSIISKQAPTTGLKLKLIGYGKTADGATDAGKKRIAENHVKDVWNTRFSFEGTGGAIGNTCEGDSGGPAFATLGGREVQVGVTSSGLKPCGVRGYDTRVDAYLGWLQTNSGGDLYDGVVPDTVKPKVTITQPVDGASVKQSLTVKATVTDDVGVTSVQVQVDGFLKKTLTASPYSVALTLTPGSRTIEVIGLDKAGNKGHAKVVVTVTKGAGPAEGTFGSRCDDGTSCTSNLCASYEQQSYCTLLCDPLKGCPQGASCLPAGGDKHVCGPPVAGATQGDGLLMGGCSMTPSSMRCPSLPLLAGLALLLGFLRRRQRS